MARDCTWVLNKDFLLPWICVWVVFAGGHLTRAPHPTTLLMNMLLGSHGRLRWHYYGADRHLPYQKSRPLQPPKYIPVSKPPGYGKTLNHHGYRKNSSLSVRLSILSIFSLQHWWVVWRLSKTGCCCFCLDTKPEPSNILQRLFSTKLSSSDHKATAMRTAQFMSLRDWTRYWSQLLSPSDGPSLD